MFRYHLSVLMLALAPFLLASSSQSTFTGQGFPGPADEGAGPSQVSVASPGTASQQGSTAQTGDTQAEYTWSFDEFSPGQAPGGFVGAVGQWQVAADDSAPSPPRVLAQLASNADDIFNVVLLPETAYQDLDMSVRLRAVAGRVDQGGGLLWRARDAQNYYIARYNPLEDNFRVYKVVDGRRRMLESTTLQLDHEAWHVLRVVMEGDGIRCYLDGNMYLEARDSTFPDGGQVGLWTKADAQTHFDDLMLAPAPSVTQP